MFTFTSMLEESVPLASLHVCKHKSSHVIIIGTFILQSFIFSFSQNYYGLVTNCTVVAAWWFKS